MVVVVLVLVEVVRLVDVVELVDVLVVREVEVVLVEEDVVLVVPGPLIVSAPAAPVTVIVAGPLWASMFAGVNVNAPAALAVSAPKSISKTSGSAPTICAGITTPPDRSNTAILIVPLEQTIGFSCGVAMVRPALRTTIPSGFTSTLQKAGGKLTSNANVVKF